MNNFDFNNLKKSTHQKSASVYPIYGEGVYLVEISKVESVPTKKNELGLNESENLVITYHVLEGPNKNNIVDIFHLKNLNKKTEEIGIKKLLILSQECRIDNLTSFEQLLNKKVRLVIKNKEDKFNNKKSFFYYEKYTENSK